MYHNIDRYRRDYVYSLFINNQNLLLDWDRKSGKSNYSVTCILDYAINHPNTHNMVIGHTTSASNSLLKRTIFCNHQRLLGVVKKTNQGRIILNNGSVIYYDSKSVKGVDTFDTILLDEITEFDKPNYISNFILYNNKAKILMNCTNYDTVMFCHIRDIFNNNNLPLYKDYFKSDEEVLIYLRNKKIQKIKTTILK